METIAIVNPMGGSGKSITAYALCCILAEQGYKVMAVDADWQGTLSLMSRVNEYAQEQSALSFLYGKPEAALTSLVVSERGFPVAVCNVNLYENYLRNEVDEKTALKNILARYEQHFDYCIIDAPPATNVWFENILMASQKVVVPENVGLYRVGYFNRLKDILDDVRSNGNPDLALEGVLLTLDDGNPERLPRLKEAANRLGAKVYQARISYDAVLDRLSSDDMGEYAFSSASCVGEDYRAFVKELFPACN